MNARLKSMLAICLLVYSWASSYAQGERKYAYRVYTPEDGLALGTLKGIALGGSGFLWVFSKNGLSRFDGHRFKVYVPDRNNPRSISSYDTYSKIQDGYGNRLFRTDHSICKHVADSGVFRDLYRFYDAGAVVKFGFSQTGAWVIEKSSMVHIDSKHETSQRILYPGQLRMSGWGLVSEMGDVLWLAGDSGIYQYDVSRKRFTSIPTRGNRHAGNPFLNRPLLFFNDGNDSVGYLSGNGIFRYNPLQKQFFCTAQLKRSWSETNQVRKAFRHKDGRIVVAMAMDSVYCIDIRSGNIRGFLLKHGVSLFDAIPSEDGSVWISTSNSGIYRLYPETGRMEHLFHSPTNRQSLETNNIEYLLEYNSVLWMTAPGLGLIKAESILPLMDKYVPPVIESLPGSMLRSRIRALAEYNDSTLLVGTMAGLFFFDKASGAFRNVPAPGNGQPLFSDTPVTAIAKDNLDNFWFCCMGSSELTVVNFRHGTIARVTPGKHKAISLTMRCLYVDSKSNLWVGTEDNLIYRLELNGFNFRAPEQVACETIAGRISSRDTLILYSVFDFYECRDGRLFIGTQDGFYVMSADHILVRHTNSTPDNRTINHQSIRCFLEDSKGNLWIGTGGGGLNLANRNLSQFISYTTDQGKLSDNFVHTILEDAKGFLWLSTNRGICRFDPSKGYYRRFSTRDGVQNNEFTTHAALKTRAGEFVLGGINGFNVFHPDSIRLVTDTPSVMISEFKVNDQDYPQGKMVHLSYDQNDLSIEFAALNYFRSRENQYAYKLEGYRDEWVYMQNRRYVNFTNLPPGRYTFRAKGCDFNGVWNETGTSMTIQIDRPYWSTLWFRALVIIFAAALVYYYSRTRFLHKLRIEKLRNRLARDLHDEIGSNLSGVALFCQVAKEKLQSDPDALQSLLTKIKAYNQSSQDAINDIVWMVNAQNDAIEKIEARMRKAALELFEPLGIEVLFDFEEAHLPSKMSMDQRRNFFLVFKEAINNIAKHSRAHQVRIVLSGYGNGVRLSIADDGKGFDTRAILSGNGIMNMQKRAHLLGGRLTVSSMPGKGTSVQLEFSK